MKKIIPFFVIALLIFSSGPIFLTNSYSVQADYYLKLDGIQGSDSVKGEDGWIRLYTVQYNESTFEFKPGSTNLSSQLTQTDNPKWTLSKQVDKSSPLLLEYVAVGKHIKEGTLALCLADTCDTILLSDVTIVGYGLNSTASPSIEKIVLQSSSSSVKESGPTVIPGWIKNNAEWFADGSIGQSDFTKGIEYMIKNGIMKIPNLPPSASGVAETKVPDWIKNNAKWWSEGQITDDDFVKGIQYLVEKGIIRV